MVAATIEERTSPSSRPSAEAGPALAEHLVALPGEPWALWRTAGLRGTGFPVDGVLRLAAPDCAAAADRVLELEAGLENARRRALDEVDAAIKALKEDGGWDDRERRNPLLNAFRALRKGKLPKVELEAGAAADSLAAVAEQEADLEAAREALAGAYQAAETETSRAIYEVVNDPLFQEAILWQNRQTLHGGGMRSLQRTPPEEARRTSRRRQNEELVASYLQRYSVKNDTIGFFGPVGWARWGHRAEAIALRPGEELVSHRQVYLESWSVEALAKLLAASPAYRYWTSPRRLPHLRLEGRTLHVPTQPRPVELTAAQAAVFAACDGRRTAHELARELAAGQDAGLAGPREVLRTLDQLEAEGLVELGYRLPTSPEAAAVLRSQLERCGDERRRRAALAALDQLEAARDAVGRAAGDVEALDRALGQLEKLFTRLTRASATRAAGRTYAGRTLLYEDCRRAGELELGEELLEELAAPLGLLLCSARWYTAETAEVCRRAYREIYDQLRAENGGRPVELIQFWYRLQPLLFDPEKGIGLAAQAELQRRWQEVLDLGGDDEDAPRRVERTSAEIREQVEELFDAEGPGWQVARYHSPDVLIAAESVEAIRRGDYRFVVGEVHTGANTLNTWLFVEQHPEPEAVARALEHDLDAPRTVPLAGKYWPKLTTRMQIANVARRDHRLALGHGEPDVDPERYLPVSELVIVERSGELRAVSRQEESRATGRDVSQKLDLPLIELFADGLSFMVGAAFDLLPARRHTPRVSIDRLVIQREIWRFDAAELGFADEADAAERFLAARRWAAREGLPRFLFVTAPVEPKPFYVDLESPIYVDVLAKIARKTLDAETDGKARLTLSEMLPSPEQSWLADARGRRYASELRLVALDQRRPPHQSKP